MPRELQSHSQLRAIEPAVPLPDTSFCWGIPWLAPSCRVGLCSVVTYSETPFLVAQPKPDPFLVTFFYFALFYILHGAYFHLK